MLAVDSSVEKSECENLNLPFLLPGELRAIYVIQFILLYIKCQSSFILVSYWLKEDHVTVTKFNC